MAEGKKSVLLYVDLISTFEELNDEEAGRLIKHFLRYVNDLDPEAPDRLTKIVFEPIKQGLKRDLKKWEQELEKKSLGGILGNLKRWHIDLYQLYMDNKITIEKALSIAESRKPSDTDTIQQTPIKNIADIAVSVSDSVIVSDSVKDIIVDDVEILKKSSASIISISKIKDILIFGENEFTLLLVRGAKTTIENLPDMLDEFILIQKGTGKIAWNDEKDLRTHFLNWAKKQTPKAISENTSKESVFARQKREALEEIQRRSNEK